MTVKKVTENLTELISLLKSSNLKSKQFAFNKCLHTIEMSLTDGITQKKTCEIINSQTKINLSLRAFETMLRRARKKALSYKSVEENVTNIVSSTKKSHGEIVVKTARPHTQVALNWGDVGVTTQRLINDFIDQGLAPEDIRSWGLPNDASRRRRLTELVSRKENE